MSVESLYQEIILDHYKAKHHSGLREPYLAEVMHVNPSCGDEIKLRVNLDGDVVTDVSYEGIGCSISQASTSVMRPGDRADDRRGHGVGGRVQRDDALPRQLRSRRGPA